MQTEVQGPYKAHNSVHKEARCDAATAVCRQMLHLEAQNTQVANRSQKKVVGQELQTPYVGVPLWTKARSVRLDGAASEEGRE